MANASRKKFGPGQQDQGKGDGSGAMTPEDLDPHLEEEPLSNREASRHSRQRGLDGRHVQTERRHDHVHAHRRGEGEPDPLPERDEADRPEDEGEDDPEASGKPRSGEAGRTGR